MGFLSQEVQQEHGTGEGTVCGHGLGEGGEWGRTLLLCMSLCRQASTEPGAIPAAAAEPAELETSCSGDECSTARGQSCR